MQLFILPLLGSVLAFAADAKYRKPNVATPQNWQTPSPFHDAQPLDSLPKGAWWTIFADPELNQYEDRAMANNQTLKAAVARLDESRATARVTASVLYPELDAGTRATRSRSSGNRPSNGAAIAPVPVTQNEFSIPFTLNYEIDLFGRVRHNGKQPMRICKLRLLISRMCACWSVRTWRPTTSNCANWMPKLP